MQDVKIEGFQLSPQQRHLWKLTQEQVDDSPYLAQCVVRIRGLADLTVLRAVLEALPARHEIMRTMFYAPEEVSTPFQVIAPVEAATTGVEYQDFSALDANGQRSAFAALRDRMSRVLAVDPTSPALIGLASFSTSEHLLVIGVPGLRCDLGGLKNLVADIARAYEARVQATDLPDQGLQYPDASVWLNDTLDSPETAVGRRFWESQDLSQLLTNRLPFEPESEAPFAPRRVPIRLAPERMAAARLFAASPGISPELVLLTCWQCLLQRTMSIETITVGYMADGRGYAELESAVGLFARCLPLSGDVSNDVPFVDAISQLASAIRDAKQWGECFDWRLIPQDRAGRTPSLPLVFEHQDWRARHVVQNVSFEIEEAWACVDRFKLKLCWSGSPEDFGDVWLEYDAGAFRETDVTRLASQLETLFAAAAANPETPLGQLRLLPASQEDEIVAQFGRAPNTAPSVALVHQRFERHAAEGPEATAVVCEEISLTYAELNGRSNQLAHYLRTVGVGPDVLVGLCVERSVDVAVGILGILKAGGAYVPLDPHLPPARLAVMLEDSGAAVVVSRTSLAGLLPSSVRLVLLDAARKVLDALPTTNATSGIGPANLAYVLFTSGSTGKPKGVAIEHQQLASYVDAVSARLDVPPGAAFATVTTYAADLGNTAIYPALTSGGCLHILTEERAADPNAFADYAERHTIDVLKIVPSHLRALLSGTRPMRVLPRQRLVLGGEACPWDLVDEVRRLAPACLVFNHYGPTETTVGATVYRIPDNGARPPAATVPIGAPLDHARAYALDRHLQIVPLWVTGELHIGGAGVARGYLADSALTQQKFIPDPWGTHTGARMYKTGDRVRMLPGGVIEFLGRIDNQVKIRGFRVELGEVEASLRRHPSVKDVAILAHDDGTGTRLSAFLVHRDGPRPTAAGLRAFLQEQGLPDYMIPTSFIGLEALPLTSNGKVDRQRLPTLLELPASHGAETEGLTEWESIVAEIWQQLLGVDQVQTRDNFYDLGGHSLMAIQVVTALERRVRVQISPRDLVFHTLKQFAALCASKSVPNADAPSSQA
jgi:amino acid adenylation domain-containing protein